METCDVTDFLIHNLFPAFPFCAEALWEISPEEGSGEGSVVDKGRRGAVVEFEGGRKRKRRKASLGNERSQSSAHVLGPDEKWWKFILRSFHYEDAGVSAKSRRAVISVQYTSHWESGVAGDVCVKDASNFNGSKADVIFQLRTSGKARGLWMTDIDSDESAVRVRLVRPMEALSEGKGTLVSSVAKLAARPSDDIIQVPETPAPIFLSPTTIESRVDSLLEELNSLRGMFNSREDSSVVKRSLGSDLKSRLRVIGVSRLLDCLSAHRAPQVLERHYHFMQDPSGLDGSDACGNAAVDVFLTDSMFTEFQDLIADAVSSSQSHVGGRAYPCPSWQDVTCYNPLNPRPISIVFPFASDFFDTIGMSPSQRVFDVFRPPRREPAVTCVLGSTEMFQDTGIAVGPFGRDVLLGVCGTSLRVLAGLRPNLPNYCVPLLRLVNSTLNSETMESNNNFEFIDGSSKGVLEEGLRSGVPGTGKSIGFRLKWSPLGWNANRGTAQSGVYGRITASLSIAFMKDRKLARSAVPYWTPVSEEENDSARILMEKILRTPRSC